MGISWYTRGLDLLGTRLSRSPGKLQINPDPAGGRTLIWVERSLDFSFGGRAENGHEKVLEWVSEDDFRCVLYLFSILTR